MYKATCYKSNLYLLEGASILKEKSILLSTREMGWHAATSHRAPNTSPELSTIITFLRKKIMMVHGNWFIPIFCIDELLFRYPFQKNPRFLRFHCRSEPDRRRSTIATSKQWPQTGNDHTRQLIWAQHVFLLINSPQPICSGRIQNMHTLPVAIIFNLSSYFKVYFRISCMIQVVAILTLGTILVSIHWSHAHSA